MNKWKNEYELNPNQESIYVGKSAIFNMQYIIYHMQFAIREYDIGKHDTAQAYKDTTPSQSIYALTNK